MPTVYTGRSPISFTVSNYNQGNWGDSEPWSGMTIYSTTYIGRTPLQKDLGYGLNELFSIMTDENNSRVIFHTGIFVDSPTDYTGRILPA